MKKIAGYLFMSLFLAAWTMFFLYPAAWHILNCNTNIYNWARLIGSDGNFILPFFDILHRFQYPNHNAIIKAKGDKLKFSTIPTAELNELDNLGYTMLAYASYFNDHAATRKLLENKADCNVICSEGTTAILLAAKRLRREIARIMMQYKPRVDLPDADGATALHYAARYEIPVIINQAASDTTNFDSVDKDGFTPLDWAVKWNKIHSVIELTVAGARPETKVKKNSALFEAYLTLCRKLKDSRKAALLFAEENKNGIFGKLRHRYNLPPELPIDMRGQPQNPQGESQ